MTFSSAARRLVNTVAELILPSRCAGCNAIISAGQAFCHPCADTLEPLTRPCQRCGQGHTGPLCPTCIDRPPAYQRARAPYAYGGQLAVAIRRLKFDGAAHLGQVLGTLLLAQLDGVPPGGLVVPVPLHPRRLRHRGFNQAVLLAQPIAGRLPLHLAATALLRSRDTPPQTRQSGGARWANVDGAFQAYPQKVAGRVVVLIDDVMTTGATVNACARALRAAGAPTVHVVALARAGQAALRAAPHENRA